MTHVRKKNGTLDMRYKRNIIYVNSLPKGTCLVCFENLNTEGRVILDCGHLYCPSCFAQHMRNDNRCGFCRKEVCVKNKKYKLSDDKIIELVSDVINNSYANILENDDLTIMISNFGIEILESLFNLVS